MGDAVELFCSSNSFKCLASEEALYASILGSVFFEASIDTSLDSMTAIFLCSTIPVSISNLFFFFF